VAKQFFVPAFAHSRQLKGTFLSGIGFRGSLRCNTSVLRSSIYHSSTSPFSISSASAIAAGKFTAALNGVQFHGSGFAGAIWRQSIFLRTGGILPDSLVHHAHRLVYLLYTQGLFLRRCGDFTRQIRPIVPTLPPHLEIQSPFFSAVLISYYGSF
jgi:hypothetical protein